MKFHLTYHYTTQIAINHLIFQNTYVFGVFCLCALYWPVLAAIAILYSVFTIVLGRLWGIPYVVALGGMACGAYYFVFWLEQDVHLLWWHVFLIAFGIILVSFAGQTIGHAVHEEYSIPVVPYNGLVAAPAMEWLALICRVKRWRNGIGESDIVSRVWAEVEDVRAEARASIVQEGF